MHVMYGVGVFLWSLGIMLILLTIWPALKARNNTDRQAARTGTIVGAFVGIVGAAVIIGVNAARSMVVN